jgi:N-acetylglucosamine-6-phosphate deacetylase
VNEGTSAPSTVTIDGTNYYMHMGETINFQGHQYSAHMTICYYCVGQHDVSNMEYALVDHGANGCICGSDMKVLEGSERFVDVVGLAGHKVSQLCIVTAQALVITHKGDVIAGKRKEYFVLFENGGTWRRYQ